MPTPKDAAPSPTPTASGNGDSGDGSDDNSKKFALIGEIAGAALVVVIIMLIWCCVKARRKKSRRRGAGGSMDSAMALNDVHVVGGGATSAMHVNNAAGSGSGGGGGSSNAYADVPELAPARPPRVDPWDRPPESVTVLERIGAGEFGEVFRGKAAALRGLPGTVEVALKTMKGSDFSRAQVEAFLDEARLMLRFEHPFILNCLGTVTSAQPLMIVLELCDCSLKTFMLDEENGSYEDQKEAEDRVEYLSFAYMIASGMAYLAGKRLVHRDLACRNVMLQRSSPNEPRICKIADFGLSRGLTEEKDYYRQDARGRVPVRWMAIESLAKRTWTSATDVWSYGVTAWEIFTHCDTPYGVLKNSDILDSLRQGTRLKRPRFCSQKCFEAFSDCWAENPEARPSFGTLANRLEELFEAKDPAAHARLQAVVRDSTLQSYAENAFDGYITVEELNSGKQSEYEDMLG